MTHDVLNMCETDLYQVVDVSNITGEPLNNVVFDVEWTSSITTTTIIIIITLVVVVVIIIVIIVVQHFHCENKVP